MSRVKAMLKRTAMSVASALARTQSRVGKQWPRYHALWRRAAGEIAFALSGERFAIESDHVPSISRAQVDGATPVRPAPDRGVVKPPGASSRRGRDRASGPRIQVVRSHAVGDVLLTTPVLRALRATHTHAEITVVTLEPEVLAGNPYVDRIERGSEPVGGDYDFVYTLLYELQPERPIVDAYADIAGVFVDDPTPQIYLSAEERRRALTVLRAAGADPDERPLVGLHMRSGWPVRDWSAERFAEVARTAEDDLGARVVLLGKEIDSPFERGADLRGQLSLRETAAAIGFLRVLVGVDSSLAHLAIAQGIPAVGLFGCTDPEKRYPPWALRHVVKTSVPCAGCHHRQRPVPATNAPACPFDTLRCMEDISTREVLERLQRILDDDAPIVSIVVPHYNRWDLLERLLTTLFSDPPRVSYEVVVVDDASTDETASELAAYGPRVRIVANERRLHSFATSCNRGARAARGRYLAFVNNDTIPRRGWLDALVELADEPEAGIVGSKLLYPDGKIQHCGMAINEDGVAEHIYRSLPEDFPASKRVRSFRSVTGACFLIERALFEEVNGFDEEYENGGEDTDLCFRVLESGRKVLYCPDSQLIHLEGTSRGLRGLDDPTDGRNRARLRKRWPQFLVPDFADYLILAEIESDAGRTWRELGAVPPDIRERYQDPAIARAGRYPYRLELGSGRHPHTGYLHLDVMGDAPSLDLLHDVAEPLPFADSCVEEILANHVLEHLSWRDVPDFVSELHRVLLPSGRVLLRTPNLGFIVDAYRERRVTPEHPDDEAAIREKFGEVTPTLWAVLKLFSGQDYPGNFHHACWDPGALDLIFRRAGFRAVSTDPFGREFSPGEIQLTAVK